MDQDLEFLNYIETSTKAIQQLEEERNNLQTKVAELQESKVILEKVASQPVFEEEKLQDTVKYLADNRMIDSDYTEKVANLIKEDPSKLLELMKKLAHSSHTTGRSVDKSDDSFADSDPDGWGALKHL